MHDVVFRWLQRQAERENAKMETEGVPPTTADDIGDAIISNAIPEEEWKQLVNDHNKGDDSIPF